MQNRLKYPAPSLEMDRIRAYAYDLAYGVQKELWVNRFMQNYKDYPIVRVQVDGYSVNDKTEFKD